jgi:hypothetical protein
MYIEANKDFGCTYFDKTCVRSSRKESELEDIKHTYLTSLFFRSVGLSQKELSNSESLQLYYRSCIDMLVSFMLQQQLPRGQLNDRNSSGSQLSGIMHQVRQDVAKASHNAVGKPGAQQGDHSPLGQKHDEEVHLVTAGEGPNELLLQLDVILNTISASIL